MKNKELFMAGKPFTLGAVDTQYRYVGPKEDRGAPVIEVDSFPGITQFRFFCKVIKITDWDYQYQMEDLEGRGWTGRMKYESLNFNILCGHT